MKSAGSRGDATQARLLIRISQHHHHLAVDPVHLAHMFIAMRHTYLLVIGPMTDWLASWEAITVPSAYACATSASFGFARFAITCGCAFVQSSSRPLESRIEILKYHGKVRCCRAPNCWRAALWVSAQSLASHLGQRTQGLECDHTSYEGHPDC